MSDSLKDPGDVLEGRGILLQHGRLVAYVNYYLTVPKLIHFVINPTGKFRTDYAEHAGGFILVTHEVADTLALADYTLELADKSKKNIQVMRRYKKVKHEGQPRTSFWVKVKPNPKNQYL